MVLALQGEKKVKDPLDTSKKRSWVLANVDHGDWDAIVKEERGIACRGVEEGEPAWAPLEWEEEVAEGAGNQSPGSSGGKMTVSCCLFAKWEPNGSSNNASSPRPGPVYHRLLLLQQEVKAGTYVLLKHLKECSLSSLLEAIKSHRVLSRFCTSLHTSTKTPG
ncbi:UNVERIFIED_CONTAM: hypothetical protein K2H54_060281 [Gekko kuhli]